jgi:carbon-monoxide dehydrogenase large subunit
MNARQLDSRSRGAKTAVPHRQGRYTDNTAPAALAGAVRALAACPCRIAGIDKARRSPAGRARSTPPRTPRRQARPLPAISEIKDAAGNRHREPPHLPMPAGKVRHVGDIVAMVVADTLDQARDAAERSRSTTRSCRPSSRWRRRSRRRAAGPRRRAGQPDVPLGAGDAAATDAAFARPRTSTTLSIRSPRQIVHYMETRAAWSAYDAAHDLVTVTFASQGVQIPHRLMCERVLNVAKDKLRLVTQDVGGGFGPKYPIYAESTLIAWATRKLGAACAGAPSAASMALSDSHRATSWRPANSRSTRQAVSRPARQGRGELSAPTSRCSRRPSRPPAWPR